MVQVLPVKIVENRDSISLLVFIVIVPVFFWSLNSKELVEGEQS